MQYAHDLERSLDREGATFHNPLLMAGTARRLGNVYAEFGAADKARLWYERAIDLMRSQRPGPSIAVAFLLWRMGDQTRLEQECRAIINDREARLPGLCEALEAAGLMERDDAIRRLAMALEELASAYLYLKAFDSAARAVGGSKSAGVETKLLQALRDLARPLASRERESFDTALRRLRALTEPWPTFESNTVIDCYRLGLALGREYFGSIPDELEAELLDSG